MRTDTTSIRENEDVAVTNLRTLRIDDELWALASIITKRRRETASGVMKRQLAEYVEEHATEEDRRQAAELVAAKAAEKAAKAKK